MPPHNVNEVQYLTRWLVALNRLITRLGEHILPLFKTLWNIANFEWTEDCQRAFEELKIYLSSPKILSQPWENEDLFLYIEVADSAVSSVLVREDDGIQWLMYYFSRTL